MFYNFAVTVPANTPASAPLELLVPLALGVITWWEINFPAGCVGLVHAQVDYMSHQVMPTNPDGDVAGDNIHIDTFDDIALDTEPAELLLRAWNLDDTYPHTLTFRFAVLSAADKGQRDVAFSALSYLDQWFRGQLGQPVTPGG